jgi:protein involved in polysaccharide export with SLBB domain
MNNFKFIILLMPFIFINAQQLDETYLESLPDDIKEDLLERADQNMEDAESNYRSSLYSSKLEQAEELIDLKTRLEADLEELERRLKSDDELSVSYDLELFGSEFFQTFQTSFMPINEPNPDSSYTLDNGDVLNIQLIGQIDFIDIFPVNRDGTINIPDVGKISVAGLTLSEASSLIKANVDSVFIGTDAYVTLDQIRDVNILVSGNAKKPGVYTLTGNSNILHALTMAGGVNEYGSYRVINLLRDGEVVETLDIYDILIDGNYSLKKRLRSGDVVFVEARKNTITIDGAVKRPAIYEVKDSEFLDSVIRFSNGIKQTADLQNISLERMLDGTLKSIPIRNISQFESIEAIEGDLIYVREYAYRTASISGAVYKPGKYTMAAGETIEDLVNKAGGFTDNAYPFGAVYENEDARLINKKAQDLLYEEFLDNIIAISQLNIGQNFDLTPILQLTEEIKNSKPSGRIVVDLLSEDSNSFLNIRSGDSLIIPERTNSVFVYGEVSSEGAIAYMPNEGVDYFVEKSGGYKRFADNESIYILHPNGETQRYSKQRNLFANQPRDLNMYPGSVIFVPRKLDNSSTRRLATQAYVSILGNLGVALASLSSINNNN